MSGRCVYRPNSPLMAIAKLRFAPGALKSVMEWIYAHTGDEWNGAGYGKLAQHEEVIFLKIKKDFADLKEKQIKEAYFKKEVAPHATNAWINPDKRDDKDGEIGVVGYEISFNRHSSSPRRRGSSLNIKPERAGFPPSRE